MNTGCTYSDDFFWTTVVYKVNAHQIPQKVLVDIDSSLMLLIELEDVRSQPEDETVYEAIIIDISVWCTKRALS